MPYNKNNPFINRVKNDVLQLLKMDDVITGEDYENLVNYQKAYLEQLKSYNPDDIYQKVDYINTLSNIISNNFAARKKYEMAKENNEDVSKLPENYDLTKELKNAKIDLKEVLDIYDEAFDPEVDLDKYVKDAEEEQDEEELVEQQEEQQEELAEQERREAERQAKKVKEELSSKKEEAKPEVEEENPELIQLARDDDSASDISISIENPKVEQKVEKPVSAPMDRRNHYLGIFSAYKTSCDEYNNGDKTMSFAEYMDWKSRNITLNAKEQVDQIDELIKTGEEAENIVVFGLDEEGNRKDVNLKADPVSEQDYNKAMNDIKANEISEQLGLLYAGKARQDARRWYDYINPFKWGSMIAENKAVKNLRENIQNKYGFSDKKMETFDKLYELRDLGLPNNFLNVRSDGQITVSVATGGTLSLNANGYIQNTKTSFNSLIGSINDVEVENNNIIMEANSKKIEDIGKSAETKVEFKEADGLDTAKELNNPEISSPAVEKQIENPNKQLSQGVSNG